MQVLTTPQQATQWLRGRGCTSLKSDSRDLTKGDAFIAWPGLATDGRKHVKAAIEQGAGACLVESEGAESFDLDHLQVACMERLKERAGEVASAFFDHPTRDVKVVAITGTNGKTSSAWWLAQGLNWLQHAQTGVCAMAGTLGVGTPGVVAMPLRATGLTTPDPVTFQRMLAQARSHGAKSCALEASSIGIVEDRLQGVQVHTAVLTNFTQDHLDFHGSMAEYWRAKEKLFSRPELRSVVVNVDDPAGRRLTQDHAARWDKKNVDVWTISLRSDARLTASEIESNGAGLRFQVREGSDRHALHVPFLGEFNVANLLGVIASMRSLGLPLRDCIRACSKLPQVPGRMERHGQLNVPAVFVDYAHTPDALLKALQTIHKVVRPLGGRTICVFGCGGERDAGKRPEMGKVAHEWADSIVVTTDNPRFESAGDIVDQILSGMAGSSKVKVESDRRQAIHLAIQAATLNDMVLVAGKGHEDYQEIEGKRTRFLDAEVVDLALANWANANANADDNRRGVRL